MARTATARTKGGAPAKVPAHSHTSLRQFEQCPQRFYRQRVTREVKDLPGKASEYGDIVHKAMELRVREGRPLPDNLKQLEQLAQFIAEVPGIVTCEQSLGCRADMTPCGFFDADVWLRGKLDVLVDQGEEALLLDYKTGKWRGDDGQAGRNAVLIFANMPRVNRISSRFLYIAENKIEKKEFTRDELRMIVAPTLRIDNDIKWATEHDNWPMRPSGLCAYCPVTFCPNWREPKRG